MSKMVELHKDAMEMLRATSRTFFIPINRLRSDLKDAVASAYLCMRAIDEIEDHLELSSEVKVELLRDVSQILGKPFDGSELNKVFEPYQSHLPEVTLRMADWAILTPATIRSEVYSSTATMAEGMADWVARKWRVDNEEDLDQYTFYVAGLVGLLLNDIWKWYDRTEADRDLAVAYGRGLQAVNILRNRKEDLARGVDYFPDGWEMKDMFAYARRNLQLADAYIKDIPPGQILDFCKIPLTLAHGTLTALEAGQGKLSRTAVLELVKKVTGR
ncbi:phytoene/squalene synthase family protein [Kroppenstedtia pulmonis]|uniref:Phytoene/squalene synthase family protein n=1 Tax=Kroppenstedtia pulmonis TaxID=1380685 RepID=A0A7D3XKF6_9BACL|nr:phytoene/squalene synthase family protein [Kroppenstedtia pulmonis]QKG85599.1 phytoene/squalene synthase family protein [Kroppenstedtia pulmonis]